MKKFVIAAALLASTAAFAAEETQSYIVSTRGSAKLAANALRGTVRQGATIRPLQNIDMMIMELTESEAKELRLKKNIRFVEPDQPIKALGNAPIVATRNRSAQNIPYGIGMLRAGEVWPHISGAPVRVGVIDSGIDYSHPDLKDNYAGGYDWVNKDTDPMDDNGHGTHVAGTIAAVDNNLGVVGVAPNVRLYALKVLDEAGDGKMSSVMAALDYAIENKLKVVNLSLGAENSSPGLEAAFIKALENNVLAVAASGNSYDTMNRDGLAYPGAYKSVLSVGAINYKKAIAPFSQRGVDLDVVAPGMSVLSTYIVGKKQMSVIDAPGGNEFEAGTMAGAPTEAFSGTFVFAGLGGPKDFPESVRGNIALIERGTYQFWEKVNNAKTAGAKAAIIFNKADADELPYDPFAGTLLPTESNPNPVATNAGDPAYPGASFAWLPTVSLSRLDGLALKQLTGEVNIRTGVSDDYDVLQGTSMASPHVTGVAALLFAISPNALAEEVRQAIQLSAVDLGAAGKDTVFGYGLVDAYAAAKHFAPHKFIAIGDTTRSRRVRRD
jgi:serine protease